MCSSCHISKHVQKGYNPDDGKIAEEDAAANLSPFESEDESDSFSDEDVK
jgi:hypothetical protein